MASITREPNGRRSIQFVAADGRRRTIRLGKSSQRKAENFKVHVEALNSAIISGDSRDADTSRWLSKLDSKMRNKLAAVGLCDPVKPAESPRESRLGPFLERYFKSRTDWKPRTRSVNEQARGSLLAFFGADKPLGDITAGDAKEWRVHLLERGGFAGGRLAKNTANDRCRKAKAYFKAAVEFELIDRNPFSVLKATAVRSNREKLIYVSRDDTLKVMDEATDAEFRLLIALCRFGGLRNPSETLALRWRDVDFASGRILITSPKTERHEGKETRTIPIFADLRQWLDEAWEAAPEGAEYVIASARSGDKNFRTRMLKTIRRAGMEPWPRVFHNLRASCQTDLESRLPSYVVCQWMGNSRDVAREHYLQILPSHFEAACSATQKAVQNPVQYGAESTRTEPHAENQKRKNPAKSGVMRPDASRCGEHQYTPQGSNLQPSVP